MTRTRTFRLALVLAALSALMAMMLPVSAAGADPIAAAIAGTAQLPNFPGTGSGSFSGTGVGIHGTAPCTGAANANFTYDDTLVVVGFADGTLTGCGHSTSFSWTRVGATAVILFGGTPGAAVAAFAPTSPPSLGGPITAAVAGVGVDS